MYAKTDTVEARPIADTLSEETWPFELGGGADAFYRLMDLTVVMLSKCGDVVFSGGVNDRIKAVDGLIIYIDELGILPSKDKCIATGYDLEVLSMRQERAREVRVSMVKGKKAVNSVTPIVSFYSDAPHESFYVKARRTDKIYQGIVMCMHELEQPRIKEAAESKMYNSIKKAKCATYEYLRLCNAGSEQAKASLAYENIKTALEVI